MIWEELDKSVIVPDLEAETWEDVMKSLGQKLIDEGYTKESYIDALITREKDFPTGLDIDWNRQLGLDPAWMRCEWDWAYQGKVQSVPVQIGRFSLSKEGVKKPIVKNGLWIQLKGSWDFDSAGL